uniref:Uncharacterized protein n=1 Tax=Lepeophtheirus salmonis TaxID=72036 RepID=A0A0K2V920_LEPSM
MQLWIPAGIIPFVCFAT